MQVSLLLILDKSDKKYFGHVDKIRINSYYKYD